MCCVIWALFYVWLSKIAVNESIGYMCSVFSLFAELPEMKNRWWFWHLIYNWLMFLHKLISNTICIITQPNNVIALQWVIHTFAESMYKVVSMLTSFTCAGVPFHTRFTIRHFTFRTGRFMEEIQKDVFNVLKMIPGVTMDIYCGWNIIIIVQTESTLHCFATMLVPHFEAQ